MTQIPDTVDAADVTDWSDEVDVVVDRLRHRRRMRGGQRRGRGRQGAGARDAPPPQAEPPSMAGGHFYLGGGTAVQQATGHDDTADEMYNYLVAVSREPDPTRSAPTATAASSTSTGWRTWAFSSSAATTRARSSCRPAPRGCPTPATRRSGRSSSRPKPAPRGHSVPVPGELGGAAMVIDLLRQARRRTRRARSATRPA